MLLLVGVCLVLMAGLLGFALACSHRQQMMQSRIRLAQVEADAERMRLTAEVETLKTERQHEQTMFEQRALAEQMKQGGGNAVLPKTPLVGPWSADALGLDE